MKAFGTWTPVDGDHELPPVGESVLTTWDHPDDEIGIIVNVDSREHQPLSDEDPEFYPERDQMGETLAWMPLPEPYDGEDDGPWTTLDDDLPEEEKTVLVTLRHPGPAKKRLIRRDKRQQPPYLDEPRFYAERGEFNLGETLAWMPLPEPYGGHDE